MSLSTRPSRPAFARRARLCTRHRLALAGAVAILAGCAHPDLLRVGMSRDELDARFGKPAAERRDGDDDVRIYTAQPLGQRASAAHVSLDGRVTAVEPLLNTQHFMAIRVDAWNKADVFAHFGPPAIVGRTLAYESWSYRYREGEVWDSLFSVLFDANGVVKQTQNGPDPMYDPIYRNRD